MKKQSVRRPRRRGLLSTMKTGSGKRVKTSYKDWFTIIPIFAVFLILIGLFVYISYFKPDLARGVRLVRTEVLDRVEKKLPDGKLDMTHSHLLVKIDGVELKLAPRLPQWERLVKGATVEVEVGRSSSDGSPVAYDYKVVAPLSPETPAPR
jgi:hypothetical protein